MEWFLKVVRDNYSNFNGRAHRKEYWMFCLFYVIFVIVAMVADNILGTTFTIGEGVRPFTPSAMNIGDILLQASLNMEWFTFASKIICYIKESSCGPRRDIYVVKFCPVDSVE